MANTATMVSTEVWQTTLDNMHELYTMRYERTADSIAAMLDRLVQAELERARAEEAELEQLLDTRSREMRSDPSQRIPLTKEELIQRGLIHG